MKAKSERKNSGTRSRKSLASKKMYRLRLYVTGQTPRSASSLQNLKEVCDEYLTGRFELDVVDIYQQPELAREAQIIAAPTLIKMLPLPLRKLVGDLSNRKQVMLGTGYTRTRRPSCMPNRKRPAKVLKKKSSAGARDKVLRARVRELEDTLTAIRQGTVDALVISAPTGDQVFTLQGAEHPYRVLVETINEGAATLDADGTVLYANTRFAEFLNVPLEKFIGAPLQSHVPPSAREKLWGLIQESLVENTKGEISLETEEGRPRLIQFSLSAVKNSIPQTICVVATELTELAEANEALRANGEALRQLSSRLLQLQDEERRHIARDLHDITGQKLAFQSIVLSQLNNALPILPPSPQSPNANS